MKRVWTELTKSVFAVLMAILGVCTASAQTAPTLALRGTVTDPSGANVPGALVQVLGTGREQRAKTDESGQYVFRTLAAGKYRVRVIAKGFTLSERPAVDIAPGTVLDVQLTIQAESQVVNVESEANTVSVDPESNGGALVLKEKELAALSDDPDELSEELQAMAGPAAGPNGGQIYIDGFTGGAMPPKSSIREVRINSNPYSTEYDRPGFGRIEILTKPGSDFLRGQAFFQYNKEALNSRSPLLAQAKRPPYKQMFYGFNISGPIKKQKASFGLDFEHRTIDENAFILAQDLDSNLNQVTVNQGILTPQSRTNITPRIDYTINGSNTLVFRYQNEHTNEDKTGIGDFNLISRAYSQKDSENTVQLTETAVLSPKAINETRFQYRRTESSRAGASAAIAINVQGAFSGGGQPLGGSGNIDNRWEATNMTTYTQGAHTLKMGVRLRQSFNDDTSVNNFTGTYSFFANNGLSALEVYRRTLLYQSVGMPPAQIRLMGGGASQFSLSAGTPLASVSQLDAGLFVNDDWRVRPNLTVSYGLRYETQTNIGDYKDLTPRMGIAWGIDGGAKKQAKTVLRAGFGSFFDRVGDTVTLNADRFNGTTQSSYLLTANPLHPDPSVNAILDLFPAIPALGVLASGQQAQTLQPFFKSLQVPRTYQASIGVERQINKYARITAQYVSSRGVHLLRTRNVNTPINGTYPYGDPDLRVLTESDGLSRTNQLIVSPNINYKKVFVFGFYSLGYGKSDAEGIPADPYNLRQEWGPSSSGDIRHRFLVGSSVPLPLKFSVSPFFFASSGAPYNITTGQLDASGFAAGRPALVAGVSQPNCKTGSLLFERGFGCFDTKPAAGMQIIGRNSARGPSSVNLSLRLSRTWGFGKKGESGPASQNGPPPGMGGVRGGGFGGDRRGGGGMPGGGPPAGMFGPNSSNKYNLMLTISARNVLNHPNFAAPSGDLSSPFFGEYRSLAGFGPFASNATYNRKVDIQLRFTF